MVWKDKFPFVDIEPSKTRIQFINESSAKILSALVPETVLALNTLRNDRQCHAIQDLSVERVVAGNLSKSDLNACLDVVENTSSNDYKSSSAGWSRAKKRKEMQLPDLRYIIIRKAHGGDIMGFASFMLTFEDGYEVIYLYEIHLHRDLQGLGLGKQLMEMFEGAGSIAEVKKAMLTVFKANDKALRFYENLGYSEDDFSPRPRKLRNGIVKEPDYVILSKELSSKYDDAEVRRFNRRAEKLANCNAIMPPSKKRKAR